MFHSLAKVLAIGLLFLAAPLFADTWTDPATGTQWEYSLSNSGEATIGKASNAAGSLTIPSTINGHRVTAIGIEAFQGCTNLTSVNIPDSATIIGDSAFLGCTSLISVTIPDSVTEIGSFTFLGCTSLTSLTIPDSVTGIGVGAFSGCTSLTTVTIPDSVTEIGGQAFEGCGAVFVEKWNTAYMSTSEGILMSADGRELLHVPASTVTYRIPDSVTTIGGGAFSGCTSLTAVTIPASVTEIWPNAFSGCTSLTSITIPESVTTIGDFSFSDCSNLRHAYLLNKTCKIAPNAFEGSPTEIVLGPPPEEPVPEEMSPSLFWVYVGVGILAVVGVVFLGIWWRKRKARARQ